MLTLIQLMRLSSVLLYNCRFNQDHITKILSPCSKALQSSLQSQRLSLASTILFVELCSITPSKLSKHFRNTLELSFTLLTCCLSAILPLQLSFCAGLDLLWCYSKVSILRHHASDFQLWASFQAEIFHIIARNPPVWSCVSAATEYPWKMSRRHWNYNPPPSVK